MTENEVEQIAEAVALKLRRHPESRIPTETHENHHRWLEQKIEREELMTGARSRIVEKIVGGLSIGAILALFGFVGHAVVQMIRG